MGAADVRANNAMTAWRGDTGLKRNSEAPRCGVCDRRCRDKEDAFACEQAHKNDPCWKCAVVLGHAPTCVFTTNLVPERMAA